jgi:hypothetical protein
MDLMDPNTTTRRANVELHIDELVLHGFAVRDRHRIAAAMERELTRLIAQGDFTHLSSNALQLDRVDAGSFHLDPAARPSYIGQTVAQRVYRQLSPSVSPAPAPTGGRNHA